MTINCHLGYKEVPPQAIPLSKEGNYNKLQKYYKPFFIEKNFENVQTKFHWWEPV